MPLSGFCGANGLINLTVGLACLEQNEKKTLHFLYYDCHVFGYSEGFELGFFKETTPLNLFSLLRVTNLHIIISCKSCKV